MDIQERLWYNSRVAAPVIMDVAFRNTHAPQLQAHLEPFVQDIITTTATFVDTLSKDLINAAMVVLRPTAYVTFPVIVSTAIDLSPEDRQQLNGSVAKILQKGA